MNTSSDFPLTCPRLSGWQCSLVAVVMVMFWIVVPRQWEAAEEFDPGDGYRTPYELSEDYWLYERFVRRVAARKRIVLLGDSVVWGEYVLPSQSLSECLNEQANVPLFANGGVNGMHPLALEGLVRHFMGDTTDQAVIVHCNLLWMTSPVRDLRTTDEQDFNHPFLVPQAHGRVPCYKADRTSRLSIAIQRRIPFRNFTQHVRLAYFNGQDIPRWTLEQPSANPLRQFTFRLPKPSTVLRHETGTWAQRGIQPQVFEWVDMSGSLQVQAFQRCIELLEHGGSSVFVIIGPFNEHLIAKVSWAGYAELKIGITNWLRSINVPYVDAKPLPTNEYADASHPLSSGYRQLAKEIHDDPAFQKWINSSN